MARYRAGGGGPPLRPERTVRRLRRAHHQRRPETPLPRPRLGRPAAAPTQQLSARCPSSGRTSPSGGDCARGWGPGRRSRRSVDAVREAGAQPGLPADSLDATGARLHAEDARRDQPVREPVDAARVSRQLTPARSAAASGCASRGTRSQSDIAEQIGTSQMQVSRLLARTLRRLRTLIGGSRGPAGGIVNGPMVDGQPNGLAGSGGTAVSAVLPTGERPVTLSP